MADRGGMDANNACEAMQCGQKADTDDFEKHVTAELESIAGEMQKKLLEDCKRVSEMIPPVVEAAARLSKNLRQHRSAIIGEHRDVKGREEWFDSEKERIFLDFMNKQ